MPLKESGGGNRKEIGLNNIISSENLILFCSPPRILKSTSNEQILQHPLSNTLEHFITLQYIDGRSVAVVSSMSHRASLATARGIHLWNCWTVVCMKCIILYSSGNKITTTTTKCLDVLKGSKLVAKMVLPHCGLVMPYGEIGLGQHWLK